MPHIYSFQTFCRPPDLTEAHCTSLSNYCLSLIVFSSSTASETCVDKRPSSLLTSPSSVFISLNWPSCLTNFWSISLNLGCRSLNLEEMVSKSGFSHSASCFWATAIKNRVEKLLQRSSAQEIAAQDSACRNTLPLRCKQSLRAQVERNCVGSQPKNEILLLWDRSDQYPYSINAWKSFPAWLPNILPTSQREAFGLTRAECLVCHELHSQGLQPVLDHVLRERT